MADFILCTQRVFEPHRPGARPRSARGVSRCRLIEEFLKEKEAETARLIKASGLSKTVLSSNDKFAAWIIEQGIPFEKVPSPTADNPDNMKWPLAKHALEFLDLPWDPAVLNYRDPAQGKTRQFANLRSRQQAPLHFIHCTVEKLRETLGTLF